MRILMLSWEYPPRVVGGLARHVQELSEALVTLGHEVHVVTAECAGEPEETTRNGVHVYRVATGYPSANDFYGSVLNLNFAMLERIMALGERLGEIDLVHAHDWLVAYTAKTLKHAWRKPLIATIHATEYGRNQGLHNELQRRISDAEWWLTYEAWHVICCSQHMRREVQGVFQVPADKLVVIPNGVNPANFVADREVDLAQFRRRFAEPEQKLVFFIGRMVQEKGAGVLIEAIPKILHYSPDTRFVLAGTGPMLGTLRDRAIALGVGQAVNFPGFVDDASRNRLFAVSQVATFPSTYEPFGIVALEGMAAGVPVVATDTGGFSEIIVHGVNGMKAYPNNPNSLADNILTLLHEPELASRMVAEARRDVLELYDWGKIGTATEAEYAKVLAEWSGSDWHLQPRPVLSRMAPGRYYAEETGEPDENVAASISSQLYAWTERQRQAREVAIP